MSSSDPVITALRAKIAEQAAEIDELKEIVRERQSAADVLQTALGAFDSLRRGGYLSDADFAARRAQLLDRLVESTVAAEMAARQREGSSDGDEEEVGMTSDGQFLAEELRLGGQIRWLGMTKRAMLKYPFGMPFANPLVGVLHKSAADVTGLGDDEHPIPVHLVEVAQDDQPTLLGFCRHFFLLISRVPDSTDLEITNVYRYQRMKRWIFQTFLTVDFGKTESEYRMFRMEVSKAVAIQRLLLRYIDLAATEKKQRARNAAIEHDKQAANVMQGQRGQQQPVRRPSPAYTPLPPPPSPSSSSSYTHHQPPRQVQPTQPQPSSSWWPF
jgi:hypothetical protein